MMFKKKVKEICGNCKLFDPKPGGRSVCRVVVLHEGNPIRVPVDYEDTCFFDQKFFDPKEGEISLLDDVKQARFWVEDEKGQKTDKNGTVKIEYPEGFFGDTKIGDII